MPAPSLKDILRRLDEVRTFMHPRWSREILLEKDGSSHGDDQLHVFLYTIDEPKQRIEMWVDEDMSVTLSLDEQAQVDFQ